MLLLEREISYSICVIELIFFLFPGLSRIEQNVLYFFLRIDSNRLIILEEEGILCYSIYVRVLVLVCVCE